MESKAITVNIPRWETDSLELICGIANAGGGYVLLPTSQKDYSSGLRRARRKFESIPDSITQGLGLTCPITPVLATAARLLEITPGWGEGVRTMREGCIQAGAELPNFDLSPEHTAVVFPLPATKRGGAAVRAKAGGKTRAEGGRDRKATAPQATGDGARRATFAERSLAAAHKLDMTQTDEYVLQVLTTNGRATAVRIAQALGVSERTVRRSFKTVSYTHLRAHET